MWKEGWGRKRVHTEGPFLEASREALHQPIVEDVIEWEGDEKLSQLWHRNH
jgi:hypothetical protein